MEKSSFKDEMLKLDAMDKMASSATGDRPSPTMADILEAISSLKDSFGQQFDSITTTLFKLQNTMVNNSARMISMECAVTDHESRIMALERRCFDLSVVNTGIRLQSKVLSPKTPKYSLNWYPRAGGERPANIFFSKFIAEVTR